MVEPRAQCKDKPSKNTYNAIVKTRSCLCGGLVRRLKAQFIDEAKLYRTNSINQYRSRVHCTKDLKCIVHSYSMYF